MRAAYREGDFCAYISAILLVSLLLNGLLGWWWADPGGVGDGPNHRHRRYRRNHRRAVLR